jgi:hypothetical protein
MWPTPLRVLDIVEGNDLLEGQTSRVEAVCLRRGLGHGDPAVGALDELAATGYPALGPQVGVGFAGGMRDPSWLDSSRSRVAS